MTRCLRRRSCRPGRESVRREALGPRLRAIAARYWKRLAGRWRTVFIVTSVLALYLTVFLLLVQLFQKVPGLLVIAPTQEAPAFVGTQLLVVMLSPSLGRAAMRGFRLERVAAGP